MFQYCNKNIIAKRLSIISIVIKVIGYGLAAIILLSSWFVFIFSLIYLGDNDLHNMLSSFILSLTIVLITFFTTLPLDVKAEMLNLLQDIKNNTTK